MKTANQIRSRVRLQAQHQVRDQVYSQAYSWVSNQVYSQTWRQVDGQAWSRFLSQFWRPSDRSEHGFSYGVRFGGKTNGNS